MKQFNQSQLPLKTNPVVAYFHHHKCNF